MEHGQCGDEKKAGGWEEDFAQARLIWDHGKGKRISPEGWNLLWEYAVLLDKWSARMNLVSDGDRNYLATRHFLPAWRWLSIMAGFPHRTVLDVGSGAGLPGIPLKIVFPETWVYLVESRRRRANFLREVIRRLGLPKVSVVHGRLEDWAGIPGGVDMAISRAVQKPGDFQKAVSPFVAPHGCILVHHPSLHEVEGGGEWGGVWSREREEGLGGGKIEVVMRRG